MLAQKRLFFGPLAGMIIVMLLAGMLYAPGALASAQIDDIGKGTVGAVGISNKNTNNSNQNGIQHTNNVIKDIKGIAGVIDNSNKNTNNSNQNGIQHTDNVIKDINGNQGHNNFGHNNIGNNNIGDGNKGNNNKGNNNTGDNNIGNNNQGNHNTGDNNIGNNNHGNNNKGNHNFGDNFTGNNNDSRGKDTNPKCNIHKYDGVCDFKKPKLKITSPHKNGKVTGPSVTISGTASDSGVGIESVKVSVDLGAYTVVSTTNGPWTEAVNLSPGVHIVLAEATDKAHNITFDHAVFTVS